MTDMKNVHIFDGLLINQYKPSKNFTREECVVCFKKFQEKSKNKYAKDMVTIMLSDYLMQANPDIANHIDWANLFTDIMTHPGLDDLFLFLEEQLHDARLLGPCAQGRSTRLLQIWQALEKK